MKENQNNENINYIIGQILVTINEVKKDIKIINSFEYGFEKNIEIVVKSKLDSNIKECEYNNNKKNNFF